jgi:Protein of unknown function (DUF2782)
MEGDCHGSVRANATAAGELQAALAIPCASAAATVPIECRMRLLCLAILVLSAPALAADERPASATAGEAKVEVLVSEDDAVRIEELRVRGQVQRISVTPKGGGRIPYHIITGDSSRDLAAGASASRGAVGQRVWHVLSF